MKRNKIPEKAQMIKQRIAKTKAIAAKRNDCVYCGGSGGIGANDFHGMPLIGFRICDYCNGTGKREPLFGLDHTSEFLEAVAKICDS